MGFGYFVVFLSLTLLFRPFVCQGPNTDESFIFEFLQKMGLNPSKDSIFSGSFCSWRGVLCDAMGENVVKLNFSGLGLSGVIPDTTISKLIKLEALDLSNNKITKLPTDFYSLGSLKNLNLSLNQISGSLPSNIGNFVELQSLDLSFNNFSGSIPEAISSLVNLQALNLNRNRFESTIPLGILKCRLLHTVDLSENRLNGSLPIGFNSSFPEMKFLNMAENRISGRASDFVGMKLVKHINISGNLFKGSVIGFFEGQLEFIDLSRNQFQGHIAQVNFFNWSNLLYLDLSENQFSGDFFSNMNSALNLKHLNLAHNRFTKQQFLQVDMLTSLEYLNLSETSLFGRIPSNISHLTNLKTLDLSKNNLSYHIPPIPTKKLRILDLSYNKLSGDIPLMLLQELGTMEMFNFSYNNLSFCSSHFSNNTLRAAFIGSVNSCPIAANPIFFKRNARKHRGLKLATILTLSMICLLVGLLLLAFGCRRKAKMWAVKHDSCKEERIISGPFSSRTDSTTWATDVKQETSVPVVIFNKPLLNFTFGDLLSATSRFDRNTLLTEGHFGPVYGGTLPGGIHIAAKVLIDGSTMTDQEAVREFEYLGRIKHPNLVPLSGYCLAGEQRIAIYDYMENGNLENLLHDWSNYALEDENNVILGEGLSTSWRFRHKIMLGIARALAFLHHGCSPPIIHRDLKATSVYFDSELEPRLSEFGLSKFFGNEITCGSRDVYGFGVILFELITGKNAVEEENEVNFVSWVRGLVRMNLASQAIDPNIRGTGLEDVEIVEALKIGYLCTAEIPLKRPSMQQVVGLLKDIAPIT